MNHALTIARLHPSARPLVDYALFQPAAGPVEFTNLTLPEEVTLSYLEAAWPATEASLSARSALRGGLLAAWDSTFTTGEKAFLRSIYRAAVAAFDAGDIASAKEIIETAPSITEDLDAKRAAIVALFP